MYTTEGIILKRSDAGEADSFFTIYTKDFGKITARAQGVKKEGAKLKGHLEPPNLSLVSFVMGKNGERMIRASVIRSWPRLRGCLEKLYAASLVVYLVDRECFAGEKDEPLWNILYESLAALEGGGFLRVAELEHFYNDFIMRLEKCLGYSSGEVGMVPVFPIAPAI